MKIACLETFASEFVCFVRLTTDTGAVGWGQTSTYNADITATIFHRQVAPWALGFAAHMTARTNSIVVGFLVTVLALWAMVVDTDLRKWMGEWMHEHHLLR